MDMTFWSGLRTILVLNIRELRCLPSDTRKWVLSSPVLLRRLRPRFYERRLVPGVACDLVSPRAFRPLRWFNSRKVTCIRRVFPECSVYHPERNTYRPTTCIGVYSLIICRGSSYQVRQPSREHIPFGITRRALFR